MMNVLIIGTNRNRHPICVLPLGACLVAQSAKKAGHRVRFLDLMFQDAPRNALGRTLREFAPDVVGLSVRNIDNNDLYNPIAYFADLLGLVETIRKQTRARVVLGGAALGVMPEALLRYSGSDCAIVGHAGAVFPKLLDALGNPELPRELPGLAWIEDGTFRINPPVVEPPEGDFRAAELSQWVDLDAYLGQMATIPIQTKRGCSFDCVYCTYALAEGRDYRLLDPQAVARTVGELVATGRRDIEFVDNVFNSPYEHAMAICQALQGLSPRARLNTLELNPRFIDDALLSAMSRAGFVSIGVTAESAADAVLTGLGKGFTCADLVRTAECVSRHDLPCMWIFLFGGPGETPQTARHTLDFARQYVRKTDVAFFNTGLRIYPNTPLERIARDQGLLTVGPNEMLEPVFYVSPQVDRAWLRDTLHRAMGEQMNFINCDSLGHSLIPRIHRIAHRLRITPPVWRYTRYIRGGLRLLGMDV